MSMASVTDEPYSRRLIGYHERTRRRGVNRLVYRLTRAVLEPALQAWFLNSLGAFPIRRGESDEEAVATSLALLERGEAVVIFPEGTRIRNGSLGRPKRGVGRLALESGAPVVPVAITGSER